MPINVSGTAHVNHQTNVWRAFLVPQTSTNPHLQHMRLSMEGWLRPRVKANLSYDRLVRQLLTAPLPAYWRDIGVFMD